MKQIIGLAFLCAGFACAEYVSTPIMAHLPDEVNYTDGAYAYAPATVYYDGVFHQFYCSRGGFTDHFFTILTMTKENGYQRQKKKTLNSIKMVIG